MNDSWTKKYRRCRSWIFSWTTPIFDFSNIWSQLSWTSTIPKVECMGTTYIEQPRAFDQQHPMDEWTPKGICKFVYASCPLSFQALFLFIFPFRFCLLSLPCPSSRKLSWAIYERFMNGLWTAPRKKGHPSWATVWAPSAILCTAYPPRQHVIHTYAHMRIYLSRVLTDANNSWWTSSWTSGPW